MKLTCNVIKDLLPLYIENLLSDDSRLLVEEHINSCDNCKKELDKMNAKEKLSFTTNALPLKKMQTSLRKKRYLTILLSISLTILILIIVRGYLTAPEYIPYSYRIITISESNNNSVIAHFNVPGASYRISKYRSEDNSGYIYDISMWSSIWSSSLNIDAPHDFLLNPDGETISSVYYNSNNGKEDVLIYGKDQNPNGGVVTLPRLVLTYYAAIAALLTIIIGSALFLFRKNLKVRSIIFKLFAFPISYLLGHFCIKGFSAASYSATRDFFTILLATIPLYCIMLILKKLLRRRKSI